MAYSSLSALPGLLLLSHFAADILHRGFSAWPWASSTASDQCTTLHVRHWTGCRNLCNASACRTRKGQEVVVPDVFPACPVSMRKPDRRWPWWARIPCHPDIRPVRPCFCLFCPVPALLLQMCRQCEPSRVLIVKVQGWTAPGFLGD